MTHNLPEPINLAHGTEFYTTYVGGSEPCTMIGLIYDNPTEVIVFRRETGEYVAKSRSSFEYSTKIGLYTTKPRETDA